jgi:hypothetical protein
MYVQRLAEESLHDRLEQIFMELLGPAYPTHRPANGRRNSNDPSVQTHGKEESWEDSIAGIEKRNLLKEALEVTGKFRELQAMNVNYDTALRELEEHTMAID